MIQIAIANLPQGKDQDACLAGKLDENTWLLAVADGVSMSDGREAAQLAISILTNEIDVFDTARSVFEQFKVKLSNKTSKASKSATTLTCGLLREVQSFGVTHLRFEFFAIGDSPIWKVIRAPDGDRYYFQRYIIHGTPYPAEKSKVYSTVCLDEEYKIKGPVFFGCTDISDDEVLVVCTDGIPEREVFVGDFRQRREDIGLCEFLFQSDNYNEKSIKKVLDNYNTHGLLYDDATIIAARRSVPNLISLTDEAPLLEDSESNFAIDNGDDESPVHHGEPEKHEPILTDEQPSEGVTASLAQAKLAESGMTDFAIVNGDDESPVHNGEPEKPEPILTDEQPSKGVTASVARMENENSRNPHPER